MNKLIQTLLKKFSVLIIVFSASFPVYAVTDGGAGWKIVAQLTQALKTMRETLILMNESVDLANDMKKFKLNDSKTWDVFENPLFEKYITDVGGKESWALTTEAFGTATELDELMSEISDESDKLDGNDKHRWEQNRDLVRTYSKMRRLRKSTKKNFKKTGKIITERESSRITANSSSGMFQVMLEDKEEEKRKEAGLVEGMALKNQMRRNVSSSMANGNYTYGAAGE